MTEGLSDYKVVVKCSKCGEQLNETLPMTAEEIIKEWTRLVLSSVLVTKTCPNGCSSFSDCNPTTNLIIIRLCDNQVVEYKELQKEIKKND